MNYIFGLPLSRAQEYSADKVGQLLSSDTQGKSLTLLAAGRRNYATMNFERYVENQVKTRHITGVLHNFFQNHPVISWRVAALTHHWHGELFFPCKKMK
jgi:Zn-dependent protease with chaperone function